VTAGSTLLGTERLHELHEIIAQIEKQHLTIHRAYQELAPWVPLLAQVPAELRASPTGARLNEALAELGAEPTLVQIHAGTAIVRERLAALRHDLPAAQATVEWLETVDQALERAGQNATTLLGQFDRVARHAEAIVQQTDFTFLYDPRRHVFHIGLNLEADRLDDNYYDLLASEARIASVIAIAKGDVPLSHWLYLGRPLTRVEGTRTLLSWSATMFEYLMPTLFLRALPGTLLADSAAGAVRQQIAYGHLEGVPWGISESGFYQFDANRNYQYRAFGVPGLGFKRGLADDLVVAPYASLMAVKQAPHEVAANLRALAARYMVGPYGCYEAIDFTFGRLPVGQVSAVVNEYMAHHQGMVLMAMANYFYDDVMVRRLHRDPRIQSVELLLHEQVPLDVPLQNPAADDAKVMPRSEVMPADIHPWSVPVHTAIPQMHLLSNGSYRVLVSNGGGGYSAWEETDLTRWQPDGTLDPWGTWLYLQDDAAPDDLWSATPQPIPAKTGEVRVTFHAHMASYHRVHGDIVSVMEVAVPPEDAVEVRRLELRNTGDGPHTLRLASYGEVTLAPPGGDARHPAFNKLFIESEWLPELNLLVFRRRPRSADEAPPLMGHMLVPSPRSGQAGIACETDRLRFLGRRGDPRRPAALAGTGGLSSTVGATLDPIFSLGQEVTLEAHQGLTLSYVTLAAPDRDALLALAARYQNPAATARAFQEAESAAQSWLGGQDVDTDELRNTLKTLSALLYPNRLTRTGSETMAANRLGQAGLWRFGISGDYPILLVEVEDPAEGDLVREVLRVHRYLRNSGLLVDVVLLNLQETDYGAELHGMLYRLVNRMNYEQSLNQRGGVFILYADQMAGEERTLLRTAARVVLHGTEGELGEQLPNYAVPVTHLPDLTPTRAPTPGPAGEGLPAAGGLQFANGYGGFSGDGREYVIDLAPGHHTPAPWANVIGYPEFGFLVTEAGSQCTWSGNSGENRLTPWSNDPVRDLTGEALYLRDEETGEVWSPTPGPAGDGQPYRARHGAGYTLFEHHSHGLRQELALYASPEAPVKIIRLRLTNTLDHTRRITATQYVEWVLGTLRATNTPFITPEYDPDRACLLAGNAYSPDFGGRVAFLTANKTPHGFTADRTEFLGRYGSYAAPVALRRMGLEARLTPGEDPCAVLQLHLDLPPGASEEIHFALGQGADRQEALALAERYRRPEEAQAAWERTGRFWDGLLGAIQVRTPEPSLDLMLNRWLLYQALSCRIWGRSGFYQSSGAFGFRDQLQDVLSVLAVAPEIARTQLLNAARHQFEEGDVLHWWHPPLGRGVRTRISDDLLWLPYVTARYVAATGDSAILAEEVPFRHGEPLRDDEAERYGQFELTARSYSLLEHCHRAIERAATQGAHGLPLMGAGDWNDGMNRVGEGGRGESVWLAWFQYDVLRTFADLCEGQGDGVSAERYRLRAREYAAAVERTAWDGAWYRRAYYDDGTPWARPRAPNARSTPSPSRGRCSAAPARRPAAARPWRLCAPAWCARRPPDPALHTAL
jgi:cyclic beta-1,2-glucan synthetase